jgi:hypothetical protein
MMRSFALGPLKKKGAPAWDRGPQKARFNCWRRFHTSAWGHPS